MPQVGAARLEDVGVQVIVVIEEAAVASIEEAVVASIEAVVADSIAGVGVEEEVLLSSEEGMEDKVVVALGEEMWGVAIMSLWECLDVGVGLVAPCGAEDLGVDKVINSKDINPIKLYVSTFRI